METRIVAADLGLKEGPWFWGFKSATTVRLILGELQKLLVVDAEDSTEVCITLSLHTSLKDLAALALFETKGDWMEVYLPKDGPIATKEKGASLITNQLNVMVSSCKWPRVPKGMPQNRTKLIAKVVPYAGSPQRHPGVLLVRSGPFTIPLRYRIQPDHHPDRCSGCHQKKEGDHCLCSKVKEELDAAKNFREDASVRQHGRAQQ